MIAGIGMNCHKPKDLKKFGNKKDEFSADNHAPALAVGDPVAIHKTSDPDHKSDDRKFPEIDKWDGKVFKGLDDLQNSALWPVLKKLKSSRFVFDKGNLNKKE